MDIAKEACYRSFADRKGGPPMAEPKSEVFQGTLDLMVLKTLDVLGPLHGYGIARRIEQLSKQLLSLNEGTVYASLLRLAQKGWIRSEWGTSENNRKARFYSIFCCWPPSARARGRKLGQLLRSDWPDPADAK
jgi:PadR family transcriptional regulator, regulatory protein PadR